MSSTEKARASLMYDRVKLAALQIPIAEYMLVFTLAKVKLEEYGREK